ncbi:MAG: hypothetical protein GX593_13250 [Actinomycetales bacterium]|nr:hypothetical protein [Actinomycetales bacterium]
MDPSLEPPRNADPMRPVEAEPRGVRREYWTPAPRPASDRSTVAKFWIGAAVAVPVTVLLAIASVLYVRAVGDGMAYATAPGAGVLALAAAIAGIVIPRSRWYVLGAITGAAILTVILVVVGVLLLYGILSAYISSGAH